jgi:hypothetical protein
MMKRDHIESAFKKPAICAKHILFMQFKGKRGGLILDCKSESN